jgi:FkbM family methyltransferase
VNRAKLYLANLLEVFPPASVQAWRAAGWRGLLLSTQNYLLGRLLVPVTLPGMGALRRSAEASNYLDNVCLGELRCPEVEEQLRATASPTVVDLGVNVGITVRWWLALNVRTRVIGVDMVEEALAVTTDALAGLGIARDRWVPISCALGATTQAAVPLFLDDPLEGTTRLGAACGTLRREVPLETLDHLLAPLSLARVDLLKCDIEGSGGAALAGGPETLARTRYVVAETHDADETRQMSSALASAGFVLFRVQGRAFWWENPRVGP